MNAAIALEDIPSPEEYARIRNDFRARVIAAKKSRIVRIGENVTLLFENRDTVLYQVLEMLRIEKTRDPEGIQAELDGAQAARSAAEDEARQIRTALGDIDAERARLLAQADAEAEALLVEGRARLEQDIADLLAKARVDLQSAAGRVNEELQQEIARASAEAIERAVTDSIDYNLHRRLIAEFIAKVGAPS